MESKKAVTQFSIVTSKASIQTKKRLKSLHAAIDVVIRRNHIHDCIMGVWLDWEAQGAHISQNLMYNNQRPEGREAAKGAMFSSLQ